MPNSVELKYTLYGDTGLSGTVGFADFMRMTQHYMSALHANLGRPATSTTTGTVNSADFTLLSRTYGQSIASARCQSAASQRIRVKVQQRQLRILVVGTSAKL